MDSKVQTKMPDNRRTKYFIVGLIAVILVLSFQLYRVHKTKNQLVRRKTFLVGKLLDCRVSAEKNEKKNKGLQTKNEQLASALRVEKDAHEKRKTQYNTLEASYESKTGELLSLRKSAVCIHIIK